MGRLAAVGLLFFLPSSGLADIVINEIHHTPRPKQVFGEFIELFNTGTEVVDVSGWSFTDGIRFTFPEGTLISPGSYLVVAEDPSVVAAQYGYSSALGPYEGRLDGDGEELILRDINGNLMDSVEYGHGFPWPTVGSGFDHSIELIHPSLDNRLPGNWRASVTGGFGSEQTVLVSAESTWKYHKGLTPPSPSLTAWRAPEFNDTAWASGELPIGYDPEILPPNTPQGTYLGDMRGNYIGVFLRHSFEVTHAESIGAVLIEALYDDGFKLWLNGTLLAVANMPTEEVSYLRTATQAIESNDYHPFLVSLPPNTLRNGVNVLAVHMANANLSDSSDAFFDARVTGIVGPVGNGPTPGRINRLYSENAPPSINTVIHSPQSPTSNEPVTVRAHVSDPDGVTAVHIEYQLVTPGNYIRRDQPAYETGWIRVAMRDDGVHPDSEAGDGVFSVEIPGTVQRHRHLVRYRILAEDSLNASIQVPYPDDPGSNFAWFCYNGAPAWSGAIRPGVPGSLGETFEVSREEMNRLPIYHLIAHRQDVEDATWRDRSRGDRYHWIGTLVHDGKIYDHIRFRPRGGVWRYAMGKNMWKFDFHRNNRFQAHDNWGRPFSTPWDKLNLGASIQQGDYLHRGEHGMFESVGFKLFQMAGVPSMNTAFVQFRIVSDSQEKSASDAWRSDFWGLYLAIEQPDGQFLEENKLPDGNLYKMESGFGEANNVGRFGPTDASDLRNFLNTYNGSQPSTDWWRQNLDLESYYGYQAIVQAIHHYDIADGKNYFYYRNPESNRWTVVPWDLDLTWADNMYRAGIQGGDEPFKSRVLDNFSRPGRHSTISREFRNRVREIRDLLWNNDETWRLIDETARRLRGSEARNILDADRAQWDYNPIMVSGLVNSSKAGHGRYYESGVGGRTFDGMLNKMKQYVVYRASSPSFSLDTIAMESGVPATPAISYTGLPEYPIDQLKFQTTVPAGVSDLAAIRWRIAEVTRPDHPAYDPTVPEPYEIDPIWDSGWITTDAISTHIPRSSLRVGHLYRVRARFLDSVGRASHWSAPIEFTTAEAEVTGILQDFLRLTELMYHPPDGEMEFVELFNASFDETLDLSECRFTQGISFEFPRGTLLPPRSFGLLTRTSDLDAFHEYYSLPEDVVIFGTYSGALSNQGETVTLRAARGGDALFSITYGDRNPWPRANGNGHSIVPIEENPPDINLPEAWRLSREALGSPGRPDAPVALSILLLDPEWSDDGFSVTLDGPDGMSFRLEWSTNLLIWHVVDAVVLPGRLTLHHPEEESPNTFYRAMGEY
jgi:hypothetical protein